MEHQMAHGRPIVGGAISRIAPRITADYREWNAVAVLMDVSADPSPDRLAALSATLGIDLARHNVRYVVVNTDAISLSRDMLSRLGLRFVEADGARELYRVGGDDDGRHQRQGQGTDKHEEDDGPGYAGCVVLSESRCTAKPLVTRLPFPAFRPPRCAANGGSGYRLRSSPDCACRRGRPCEDRSWRAHPASPD